MTTEQKNSLISGKILALVASGMNPREAFDAVVGEGAYAALASNLYDALRAKGK